MNQIYKIVGIDVISNDGQNKLVALKNNFVDKLERVKEMDMKLEHLLIEDGDNFVLELNNTLLYHKPFYELFFEYSWDFDKVLEIFNSQLTARQKCAFVGGNGKCEGRMKPLP